MDPRQAYRDNGYYIFRDALATSEIRKLWDTLETEIVQSNDRFYRQKSRSLEANRYVQDSEGKQVVSNALLNPHGRTEAIRTASAIRDLICTVEVADLLGSIDGATSYTIHQTIVFFTPPKTDMHVDGWSFDSQPRGYNHTLWIPLERVTLLNSPIAIVPWPLGRFIPPEEFGLVDFLAKGDNGTREDYHNYHNRLIEHVQQHRPDCVVPHLNPGDLVVFSSLTPHATMPYRQEPPSRRAIQVLIRDSSRRWASWEQQIREGTTNAPDEPCDRLMTVSDRWRLVMS